MALPTAWPPRPASGRRSARVYVAGTATADWADNAYLFQALAGANTYTTTPYTNAGTDEKALKEFGDYTKGGVPAGGRNIPQDVHLGMASGVQAPPQAMTWVQTLKLKSPGAGILEFSFDAINIHGEVAASEIATYRNRFEAGIAVRFKGDVPTGSITTIAVASLVDGETFVIDDGVNPAVTFEFDTNASVVETATLRQVDISAAVTADNVRDAVIVAVTNALALNITATDGGAATVSLVNDLAGTAGNVAITDTVANVGFILVGMTGGTGADTAFVVEGW